MKAIFQRYRTELLYAALFSFVSNLFVLASPLFMLQVYDRVLPSHSLPTLAVLMMITVLLLMAMSMLDTLRGRLMSSIARRLDSDLGEPLAKALLDQSRLGPAPTQQASLRDLGTVTQFVSSPGLQAFFDAPWLPMFMLIIFMMHWIMGCVALMGAALLFGMALLNEHMTRKGIEMASGATSYAHRHIEALSRVAEVLSALGMTDRAVARWRGLSDHALEAQRRAAWIGGVFSGTSKFFRYALQSSMLGLGAWLVIVEHVTPGIMIAATILLGRALAPVDLAVGSWRNFIEARVAFRRIAYTLSNVPTPRAVTELPAPTGILEVENLRVRLGEESRDILSGISFTLSPGECLGIVGPSGAGKSTLIRALAGVVRPASGRIRLDGAELDAWPLAQRAMHFGYLPQGVQLVPGTIAQNIGRLVVDADAAIITAARRAFCHDMIVGLPGAYDTDVGEAGERLAPGQRQRIALARALFGQPSLVVLDEPNASLDGDGEQALLASLKAMRKAGVTVVIAGHKPSLMMHCDRLLVLNNGGVEMIGPSSEILGLVTGPSPVKSKPGFESGGIRETSNG